MVKPFQRFWSFNVGHVLQIATLGLSVTYAAAVMRTTLEEHERRLVDTARELAQYKAERSGWERTMAVSLGQVQQNVAWLRGRMEFQIEQRQREQHQTPGAVPQPERRGENGIVPEVTVTSTEKERR